MTLTQSPRFFSPFFLCSFSTHGHTPYREKKRLPTWSIHWTWFACEFQNWPAELCTFVAARGFECNEKRRLLSSYAVNVCVCVCDCVKINALWKFCSTESIPEHTECTLYVTRNILCATWLAVYDVLRRRVHVYSIYLIIYCNAAVVHGTTPWKESREPREPWQSERKGEEKREYCSLHLEFYKIRQVLSK